MYVQRRGICNALSSALSCRLPGYKIYYNKSKINKSDGVVTHIHENLIETTETLEVGELRILNTTIKLITKSLVISAIYRSHDMPKNKFLSNLKMFLNAHVFIYCKKHIVIGDFYIEITENNIISQEFLCNFLELMYIPGFVDITRHGMLESTLIGEVKAHWIFQWHFIL